MWITKEGSFGKKYEMYAAETGHGASTSTAVKGTVPRDFRLLFFSWISFSKPLSTPIGPFRIFSKMAICHRCRWHQWQICRRYLWHLATGINNTSKIGGKICRRCRWYRQQFCRQCCWHGWQICHRCRWYRWCTLTCEYLREFLKKFETVLTQYSGAGGKLIHQKNQ